MKCNICNSNTNEVFKEKILNKYSVKYYYCPNCNFLQTEKPFWLKEIYKETITSVDVGIIYRNITIHKKTSVMLTFFNINSKNFCVDFGGGDGMFTRLMRDVGFNFQWYDLYTKNIFAKGFEKNKNKYEAITSFECFEHLDNPIKEIEEMLKYSNTIIFTTQLLPNNEPAPKNWDYYGFHHGQHISFYSLNTLKYLAKKYNLRLYSESNYHVLTNRKKSKLLFKLLNYSYFLIFPLIKLLKKSRTNADLKYLLKNGKN